MEKELRELEERIERLERKDKRRKTFAIIKFIVIVLLVGALAYGGYKLYTKVEETIKPYKEVNKQYNEIRDKLDPLKGLFE